MSRRGLFGAGLSRALAAPWGGEPAPVSRRPSAVAAATAGEADGARLGPQLAPIAELMLDRAGLAGHGGARVVVVAAGDGTPLAAAALRRGHRVLAVEADPVLRERGTRLRPEADWRGGRAARLPVGDAGADAVLAWFGATHEPDPRAVAAELRRVVRPGGAIALAAWTPEAMRSLRGDAPRPAHRPEQWSRYETAYRHFFDLPGLDVHAATAGGLECAIVAAGGSLGAIPNRQQDAAPIASRPCS